MLLTLTTTHRPASDLGYLLHKNPARFQTFELAFGSVHVFYPEVSEERCTAALLLDVDPVKLIRGSGTAGSEGLLDQYVNDRPYVASSFLSVAVAQTFASALSGRSKDRPELAATKIPLLASMPALPCRGGEALLRRLFTPLGYEVTAARHALDERFPEWGESRLFAVTIGATTTLAELLTHLYVLVPVLDDEKHYFVGDDEVEKLVRFGEGWLPAHPERETITRRYLKHQKRLTRDALARLVEDEKDADPDASERRHDREEEAVERPLSLNEQRMGTVLAALKASGARRVLDLGCGEGRLLGLLLADASFEEIVGVDVSCQALEIAADRLRLDRLPEPKRKRIRLLQGSLTYRDDRLTGYDAAAAVEVIEHLDPHRLESFVRCVFELARPGTVVLTTPNAEYNARFESLPAGSFRHRDHRFEWTREQLQAFATEAARRFGYAVRFAPIGAEDPALGPPTQMAIFTLAP